MPVEHTLVRETNSRLTSEETRWKKLNCGNKVSIIIPAYNEENGLPLVLEEILTEKMKLEVIVVDDGSTDKTFEVAKKYGVTVLKHEQNQGKVAAIFTGIEKATNNLIVIIDADYTYPSSDIQKLINEIMNGADLAIGSRFFDGGKNVPFLNRIGNKFFSFVISWVSGYEVTDAQSGFRAFKKDFLNEFQVKTRGLAFETEMTTRAGLLGFKIVEVPIQYRKRIGKSKLRRFRDGLEMFLSVCRIVYRETSTLAKTLLIPSVISAFFGFAFVMFSLYDYFATGLTGHGYFPLLAVLFSILSIQLFGIGFLANYLIRKMNKLEGRLKGLG